MVPLVKRALGPSLVVVLVLGLAGCSGGSDPAPVALPTLGAATPTAGGTATPTIRTVPTDVPREARALTALGADAFVRYFFGQLNNAFSTSDGSRIRAFTNGECETCENYAKALDVSKAKGTSIKGDSFMVSGVAAREVASLGTIVEVFGEVPPREIVDARGVVKEKLGSDGGFHFEVAVKKASDGWLVSGIRLAK